MHLFFLSYSKFSFNSLQVGSKLQKQQLKQLPITCFNSLQVGSKPGNLLRAPGRRGTVSIPYRQAQNWNYQRQEIERRRVSIPYRQAQNFLLFYPLPLWSKVSIPYRQAQNGLLTEIEEWILESFNSLQVGSKLTSPVLTSAPASVFQFLIGRLKTISPP